MSREKGVIKHQSEKLVNKVQEKVGDAKPSEAAKDEAPKRSGSTVRLGVDNHLIDSYEFPVGDERFLIKNVNRGGSEVPKDREQEIRNAARVRGYLLAEVE